MLILKKRLAKIIILGFWVSDNRALFSQMQCCRSLPTGLSLALSDSTGDNVEEFVCGREKKKVMGKRVGFNVGF